jgi:Zn-dependent protease with chaperone function
VKFIGRIFGDWLTRSAAIIFILIIALVAFNQYSNLPEEYPLFGVLEFALLMILFVLGGIVFVRAVLRFSR